MLLSKRERPPDNVSATSNKPSSISYSRTTIPSISPVLVVSSGSPTPSTTRRAPLAPLDPQATASMSLDDQASAPSDCSLEAARAFIGRPIMTWPQEEDPGLSTQSLRKRSLSGHNSSVRPSPYPQSRTTQRRPSNTPPVTDPRRPSLPTILYPPPSPRSTGLSSPSSQTTSLVDVSSSHCNEDIYSGLSTFTFGAARPPPPSHPADTSDMISPLTRVPSSADRTPRPSISSTSSGRHRSRAPKVADPDEGDDEYEDEDDAARGKTRSKMRAIDDGSRRPSLPTNTYIPYVSTDSSNAVASSPRTPLELSPGGSSASESAYDDSEVDQDETELAEFDTDVELDLPHGPGTTAIHDPPVSDTASQHTFGGGSFNHYSSGFMHASSIPSVLDDDDDMDSTSPVSFAPDPEDEQFDDGDRPLPSLPAQRKASLPWEIPSAPLRDSASGVTRGREDSAATVTARRASRSVDDDLTASTMYPDVQVATAVSLRSAEFDDQALSQPTPSEEQEYQYGEYNLDYILGGGRENWSRKSWSSGAPSYIQARRSDEAGDPGGLGAAWDAAFHRRPSTATVNSGEDAFTRHVRDWDSLYNTRRIEWSFRPESTDGRGPHRMPLTPTTSENRHQNMQPGAQELWRQAYVGRFKVDRVKMNPDHPPKAPQQRLNVRHVTDPFSKGNKLGGPGSVIHKHSRAIAFSIFRNHSLFSRSHRQHKQPMHTSISILLANKKVQEQYTSTRTTSRLNSHGLLEDVGTIETSTSFSQTRTMVSSAISARSRPGTPHAPADGSQSEGYVSDQRGQCSTTRGGSAPAESSSSRSPTLPPSVPPPTQSNMSSHSSALSSSSIDASEMIRVSGDSFSQGEASTMADRNSTLVGQSVTTITSRSRRNSLDVDDEDSPPRTSHAEAFATVDSSYFERTRTDRRMEEPSSHGLVQSLRRKLLGSSKGSSKSPQSTMPPALPREGNYTPPWLTMAPRSKQEERERVIQNLNESFKDVGLLPTARISNKASSSKGKRSRHPNVTTIFENVPADSLYMLLPLWPGDTDPASENGEDPASSFVPVEERQYLLVYYVPFEEKIEEKKSDQKKRARADTRSIATASSMTLNDRDRIISLRCFKAVARLVSYIDLRETGVRVPSFGLSVTGSLKEATRYLPPPSIREEKLDDIAIGSCMGRERGVEFYPEGLQKLGLCMPTLNPPRQPTSETDVVEEEEVLLTPIGRAAVEMAWLGCMAVTSFTST